MSEKDTLWAQRARKAEELREAGFDPYANDFSVDTSVAQFLTTYDGEARASLESVTQQHAVAGRVMAINRFGKAAFIRIQDASADTPGPGGEPIGRLQIYVRSNDIGAECYGQVFKRLDLGDIVGVVGEPMRTKTDELSLHASSFRLLTKALRSPPEKWHGLTDVETRYRQRYLDLMGNAEVRRVFKMRSRIVAGIREFFLARDFLEVETPMMHSVAGGAAARPFTTHHNTLNADLYLRIAPELYLKRLVVGGLERVFEINRNFRNEGISTFHNPEFTMLEFYQTYCTYLDLMQTGEDLISGLAQQLLGTTDVTFAGASISLAKPFARMSMLEAIEHHGGPNQKQARDPKEASSVLERVGINPAGMDDGAMVVALFEHFAEAKLIAPTFIYDFPASVSPLSRKKSSDPWFVDRFELFVGGHELANAFSELNDPMDQKARFEAQLEARAKGDDEAHKMDNDYITALEHGMPPTGGFGLGVDRLVMLLTGVSSIRDVILFPLLRPKTARPDQEA